MFVGLGLAVWGIRWYATQKANWQQAVAEAQADALTEAMLGIDSPQEVEVEQVRWEDLFHPQVRGHRRVAEIDLKGRSLKVENPVVLSDDVDVYVNGPGTLDIDVTGSRQSSIRIQRDGTLLNRTGKSAAESSLGHVVDDSSYLNFVNLKKPAQGEKRNVQIGENAKRLIIRYGGPQTRREAQLEHYRGRGILK